MPWAAYFGIAALVVAVVTLLLGRSRLEGRGITTAIVAFVADAAGRIEGSDTSRWSGFTDDIVIRITPSGTGSRIDPRSSSRLGRSDFGVNAARSRGYLAALRAAAGRSS